MGGTGRGGALRADHSRSAGRGFHVRGTGLVAGAPMNAIAPRARGPRGPKPGDPRTREERDYHDAVRLLARLTSMALTLDASVQRARGREPGPAEGGRCGDYS